MASPGEGARLFADVEAKVGSLDLRLTLESDAQWISIVGPSGAGKSTFLRILAGVSSASRGVIRFGGDVWLDTDAKRTVPAWSRRVGWVPQDDYLFPHLSVTRNLLYGASAPATSESVTLDEVVGLLDVADLVHRRPRNLSGGERQRVALGRALLRDPSLLLLDEPFSALDPSLRESVAGALKRFTERHGVPAIVVSHDEVGNGRLSDERWVLSGGRLNRA